MIKHQSRLKRHPQSPHGIVGIGFDPDLHNPAMAVVHRLHNGKVQVIELLIGHVHRDLSGHDAVIAACEETRLLANEALGAFPSIPYSVACEGQRVYSRASNGDPADLINLATISGAALASLNKGDPIKLLPVPSDWKGEVKKETNQGRSYLRLGWPCSLHKTKNERWCIPVPSNPRFNYSTTEWKHLGDAIGLAIWAAETTWPL